MNFNLNQIFSFDDYSIPSQALIKKIIQVIQA